MWSSFSHRTLRGFVPLFLIAITISFANGQHDRGPDLIHKVVVSEDVPPISGSTSSGVFGGRLFDYVSNLMPGKRNRTSSSTPTTTEGTVNNDNSRSSLLGTDDPGSLSYSNSSVAGKFRKILLGDNASWQEAYDRFLSQVKKVRGALFRNGNSTAASGQGANNTTATDVKEAGRLFSHSPGSSAPGPGGTTWVWPWSPSLSPPPSSDDRSGGHIFLFGPFNRKDSPHNDNNDEGRHNAPSHYPRLYHRLPSPSPPRREDVGGVPTNFVFASRPPKGADLETHTTTTIYIICICLIIMLVGTVLFAVVSRCQEKARLRARTRVNSNADPNPSRRRRRHRSGTSSSTSNNSRPPISIVLSPDPSSNGFSTEGGDSSSSSYPKVIYDAPPSYDSLFPIPTTSTSKV